MTTVRLVHWKAEEAVKRIVRLRHSGFQVQFDELNQSNYRQILRELPEVVVIDLGRLPSHGREVARYFRDTKATRHLPVVFVGGAEPKVERARQEFPDAVFADWTHVGAAVRKALKQASRLGKDSSTSRARTGQPYSRTPLAHKLGIRSGHVVALVAAPDEFVDQLAPLPGGVTVRRAARGRRDVTVFFARCARDLETRFDRLARAVQAGQGLWVAWPKKSSGIETDVTQDMIRKIGLANGLVDNKICAIDATWSALRFALRRK